MKLQLVSENNGKGEGAGGGGGGKEKDVTIIIIIIMEFGLQQLLLFIKIELLSVYSACILLTLHSGDRQSKNVIGIDNHMNSSTR